MESELTIYQFSSPSWRCHCWTWLVVVVAASGTRSWGCRTGPYRSPRNCHSWTCHRHSQFFLVREAGSGCWQTFIDRTRGASALCADSESPQTFTKLTTQRRCLPVRLRAVFYGTAVVPSNLSGSPSVPLPFLLCNVESHAEGLFMFTFIGLEKREWKKSLILQVCLAWTAIPAFH